MRWLWSLMLGGTTFLVVDAVSEGSATAAIVYGTIGRALTWWFSPWQGGRNVRHAEIESRPESGGPVVIWWRPVRGVSSARACVVGSVVPAAARCG